GYGCGCNPEPSVMVYDPASNAWSVGPPLIAPGVYPLGTSGIAQSAGVGPDGTIYFGAAQNHGGQFIQAVESLPSDVTVPDAPTTLVASGGNGDVLVSFTPPANNGGKPITSYTVTCTSPTAQPGNASGGSSPIDVTGLSNGDVYTCTATATNSVGTSAPSS